MTPSGMLAQCYLNEYLVKIEGDRFKDCSYGVSTDVKTYHHKYLSLDRCCCYRSECGYIKDELRSSTKSLT